MLTNFKDLVQQVKSSKQQRLNSQIHQEIIIDDDLTLQSKCLELAKLLIESKTCVVYTGAGISTAASIPDYRGPNGLWTMLEKGVKLELPDFTNVQPTYSHMALLELVNKGLIKHIVSQNCDGLHLRSGLDRSKLSELHGNCFVEFCPECNEENLRLFDVTEKSSFRKHSTGRYCKSCSETQLRDSIIHFGEKLRNGMPYNWETARDAVKSADLIICFGTSLKVLKHYACLWPKKKGVHFCIVNIQWTSKDKMAKLKLNGYCDDILRSLISNLNRNNSLDLNVCGYTPLNDPLLRLAVRLEEKELCTTTKCILNDKLEDDGSEMGVSSSSANSSSWFTKSFKLRKQSNVQVKLKKDT